MSLTKTQLAGLDTGPAPVFVTWRLDGSLPPGCPPAAFSALDRILDAGSTGPLYMRTAEIAGMIADTIEYGDDVLRHYTLHEFAVMPNHVHVLLTPKSDLSTISKSLRTITANRGNALLGNPRGPFWNDDSHQRPVRDRFDFDQLQKYIRNNPVKAGLVSDSRDYPWCSASRGGFNMILAGNQVSTELCSAYQYR